MVVAASGIPPRLPQRAHPPSRWSSGNPPHAQLRRTPQQEGSASTTTCTGIAQHTGAFLRFTSIETQPPRSGSNSGATDH
ncbi:hypothetical protein V5799_011922 [Amblyomma americanum]|uniref:Uncharacterized protein n=1 Tax=Amblyomma americanum TaxID=6943 RepID=A0AAQ4EFQ8_AMBAM